MGMTKEERSARKFVVYVLTCPVSCKVRYVGMTSNPAARAKNHSTTVDGSVRKRQWVLALQERGLRFRFDIVTAEMTFDQAVKVEANMIRIFETRHPGQILNAITTRTDRDGNLVIGKESYPRKKKSVPTDRGFLLQASP